MSDVRCLNCKYFETFGVTKDDGICHRYAPHARAEWRSPDIVYLLELLVHDGKHEIDLEEFTPHDEQAYDYAEWPRVGVDSWCGDFTSAEGSKR